MYVKLARIRFSLLKQDDLHCNDTEYDGGKAARNDEWFVLYVKSVQKPRNDRKKSNELCCK